MQPHPYYSPIEIKLGLSCGLHEAESFIHFVSPLASSCTLLADSESKSIMTTGIFDLYSVGASLLSLISFGVSVYIRALFRASWRFGGLRRYYGTLPALFLTTSCIELWSVEAELLLERNDEDAKNFRQSQHEDCNMTAVAVRTIHHPSHSSLKQDQAGITLPHVIVGR